MKCGSRARARGLGATHIFGINILKSAPGLTSAWASGGLALAVLLKALSSAEVDDVGGMTVDGTKPVLILRRVSRKGQCRNLALAAGSAG
jgi:hypothetical protein